jgi:hypothetical protein
MLGWPGRVKGLIESGEFLEALKDQEQKEIAVKLDKSLMHLSSWEKNEVLGLSDDPPWPSEPLLAVNESVSAVKPPALLCSDGKAARQLRLSLDLNQSEFWSRVGDWQEVQLSIGRYWVLCGDNLVIRRTTSRATTGEGEAMKLKPRHRWFSAIARECEDGWYGPCKTIEQAISECVSANGSDGSIFVGQGYRLNKQEKEDWGAEFDWQVDTLNAFEVVLPHRSRST